MRNTDMMNEYIEHIKNIKRLTADEEFELAVKMRNGDKKARDRFIEANMYLVVYYCKPYIDFGVAYEDLFQEGTVALIKAVDNYNPIKAVRFRNYAYSWIMSYIEYYLPENICVISAPKYRSHEMSKIISAKNKLKKISEIEPTSKEIADLVCLPELVVEELLSYIESPFDLDALIDEDEGVCWKDTIQSNEEEVLESYAEKAFNDKAIGESFSKLSPREKIVIRMCYGLDGEEPMTYEEIGKIVGVTGSRVGGIKKKAIAKMGGYGKPKKRRGKRKYLGPGYY